MHDNVAVWILLVLSFPVALFAVAPVVSPPYRLFGRKFIFALTEIQTMRFSTGKPDQLAIYRTSVQLRSEAGHVTEYSFKNIEREQPTMPLKAGEKIEMYAIPWLVSAFGWSPQTSYSCNKALHGSVGIYVPFWFMGVLPFVSACYYLLYERNLLFDVLNFFLS